MTQQSDEESSVKLPPIAISKLITAPLRNLNTAEATEHSPGLLASGMMWPRRVGRNWMVKTMVCDWQVGSLSQGLLNMLFSDWEALKMIAEQERSMLARFLRIEIKIQEEVGQ